MPDIYNFKFRIKFLRTATIQSTPINPGNFLVDIQTGKVYLDILTDDNNTRRINLSGGIVYCGTVPTFADLPTATASNGDMYNVADTGANYVWSETDHAWDKLSENVDLSNFYTKSYINSNYYKKSEIDTSLNNLIAQLDAAS